VTRKTAIVRSLVIAVLFTVASAAVALAYSGQVAGQITLSGPSFTIACSNNWYLFAHVTEAGTGSPIEGQPVAWSIVSTPDPADYLVDTNTVTDHNGDTRTTLHVTGTPGQRTIQAQADTQTGRFTLDCEAGGLPPTSTAGPTVPDSPMNYGLLLAAFAVLSGLGILTFRFVRR